MGSTEGESVSFENWTLKVREEEGLMGEADVIWREFGLFIET